MTPSHTPPIPVLPSNAAWPLHSTAASRRIEAAALAMAAPQALMETAGLVVARLAQAVAPGSGPVWVAAGPGNNGGDGLLAALHLRRWGRSVQVNWLGRPDMLHDDARAALAQAQAGGVAITHGPPAQPPAAALCIDALLGLGTARAPAGAVLEAIRAINNGRAPVLAVDLPTGLAADTGQKLGEAAVCAQHTLALLTLKPGLFTADGRDHSGRIWLHRLGQPDHADLADAWLTGPPAWPIRGHTQHKGSFGDVVVLGGARGMAGAALLAARAALAAGAGRVFLALLGGEGLATDPLHPELMPRLPAEVLAAPVLAASTVVCGCGGGAAVAAVLPEVLLHARQLVLDADGLNAVASDAALARLLTARADMGLTTVLTPHPLEAARLLTCSTPEVQQDRLAHAHTLAQRFGCTVVLKGSGSVVATPGTRPCINPTGNARLGTAGSGDVLAGWLGGAWASAQTRGTAHAVAAASVWLHGRAADLASTAGPLCASALADTMLAAMAEHASRAR